MQYRLCTVNLSRILISAYTANPAVYADISPQCIGITDGRSKPIRRAVNAAPATIQDVCVIMVVLTSRCAKEFSNRSGVMLLRAVIGLSYIDAQEILSRHGKRNRLSSPPCSAKSALPHASPLSTHFPESSLKSAVLS